MIMENENITVKNVKVVVFVNMENKNSDVKNVKEARFVITVKKNGDVKNVEETEFVTTVKKNGCVLIVKGPVFVYIRILLSRVCICVCESVEKDPTAGKIRDQNLVGTRLQQRGRHLDLDPVFAPLRRIAEDRRVAGAFGRLMFGHVAVDADPQLRRGRTVRIDQIEHQPAVALADRLLDAEQDRTRMGSGAEQTAVDRTAVPIGPVPLRIGLPDDKHRIGPKRGRMLRIAVGPKRKLARIVVRFTNFPENLRRALLGSEASLKNHDHAGRQPQASPDRTFHDRRSFLRLIGIRIPRQT